MIQYILSLKLVFFKAILLVLVLLLPGQNLVGQETYPDTIDLYPATIIFIRSGTDNMEALELDYQDKMAHDGGGLLD